mmetsp:Transcript_26817/g.78066  ORF Transcript_26817/g.78066 Transcript_26817/m.78066 type:complete len:253 (-) Transcript_26817:91-849(-)
MDWLMHPSAAVVQAAHVSAKISKVCGPSTPLKSSVTLRAVAARRQAPRTLAVKDAHQTARGVPQPSHPLDASDMGTQHTLWQRLQSKTSQPRAKVMRHPARLRVGGPGGLPKYLDLVLAITMHHPLELSSSHAREGRVACKGHQQRLVHGLTLCGRRNWEGGGVQSPGVAAHSWNSRVHATWKRGGDEGSSSAMGRMWSQDHRSPAPNDLDQGDYQPDSRKGHQEPHKQVEEPAQGHQGVEPRRYSHWPGES